MRAWVYVCARVRACTCEGKGGGGVGWLFAGILHVRIFCHLQLFPPTAGIVLPALCAPVAEGKRRGGSDNRRECKAREQERAGRWYVIATPRSPARVRV